MDLRTIIQKRAAAFDPGGDFREQMLAHAVEEGRKQCAEDHRVPLEHVRVHKVEVNPNHISGYPEYGEPVPKMLRGHDDLVRRDSNGRPMLSSEMVHHKTNGQPVEDIDDDGHPFRRIPYDEKYSRNYNDDAHASHIADYVYNDKGHRALYGLHTDHERPPELWAD